MLAVALATFPRVLTLVLLAQPLAALMRSQSIVHVGGPRLFVGHQNPPRELTSTRTVRFRV